MKAFVVTARFALHADSAEEAAEIIESCIEYMFEISNDDDQILDYEIDNEVGVYDHPAH